MICFCRKINFSYNWKDTSTKKSLKIVGFEMEEKLSMFFSYFDKLAIKLLEDILECQENTENNNSEWLWKTKFHLIRS